MGDAPTEPLHPSPAAPSSPDVPEAIRVIGPYRLISRLGEGGFGEVYLAEQVQPVQRRVAIKIMKAGMDSQAILARFEAERHALVLIDHPNVAQVLDAGVAPNGRSYFVMEHVAGEPISHYCRHEHVGVRERVSLVIQVCYAVHHAHMKGVIHRDLKPANILVELVDGRPTVKVIDFGVAKALHRSLREGVVTEVGQMIGTPEYMSPEQARATATDIDTRADVYALGAVLYELLTGATPLDSRQLRAAGYAELQRLIEEQTPALPSQRVTGVNAPPAGSASGIMARSLRGELDWIVMRCLEKDRARRYESAAALARDLERYLQNQPVDAGPPSAAYRFSKFIQRNRTAVAAGAAGLALLVGALGMTSWALQRARTERGQAQQRAAEALAAREEAEAATTFIVTMFESVEPGSSAGGVAGGKDVTVRQVLDRAAARLESQDHATSPESASPLLVARLRHTIGSSYHALGDMIAADKHLSAAVALREKHLGPAARATLHSRFNLASVWFDQGRFDEAQRTYEQCLASWRESKLTDDEWMLGALNNLAQIMSRRGDAQGALSIQRDVHERASRAMGPTHEHTLGMAINLGAALRHLGRFDEAEKVLSKAEADWRTTYGAEHPGTLLAMHNQAMLAADMGDRAKGAEINRRLVEARTRVLGPDHPDTLGAMTNLGLDLRHLDPARTEPILLDAWRRGKRVLGEEHEVTISAALNLTDTWEALGWPASSRDQVREVATTLKRIASRPDATAHNLNAAAWLLLTLEPESARDIAGALQAAIRACDVERKGTAAELWQYLDTLALAYSRAGNAGSAVAAQREALERLPAHPQAQQYKGEMQDRLREYEAAAK